ncbi:spore germination protein GerPB [Piscibacillus halophilus]|uniref:Spore germination protein PB n=1 Tax=Piscibacillus halophilus TaxID=571933 RepID=A0A1H9B0R9_9BACI|nr:spore germination protein GerPB [Piscibacillus halophilus]SEP82449.1 spore germination protein PB [Piscibacillus halophilus]
MCLTIQQQISIQFLKVESITNSSVLQIGSSGTIQAVSNAYNTGGYTGPVEEAEPQGGATPSMQLPFIPFTN